MIMLQPNRMRSAIAFRRLLAGSALTVVALLPLRAQTQRLTVDEAVDIALRNNRDARVAALEIERAEEKVREADGGLLPTISASGSYSRYLDRPVQFLPAIIRGDRSGGTVPIEVGSDNAYSAALTVTVPILNWGARAAVNVAEIGVRAGREAQASLRAGIAAEVKRAYYGALLLAEQRRLQQQSLDRNEQALADARHLLENGLATDADTLRAYVNAQNLRPPLSRLSNQIAIAVTNLKIRMGMDPAVSIELADGLDYRGGDQLPALDAAVIEAAAARPDFRQLEANIAIARAQVEAERAGHMPTLSGIGHVSTQTQANDFDIGRYQWPFTSFVGVQLAVPIFSGSRVDSRVRQADLAVSQNETRLENARELLRAEVMNSLAAVDEARQRIEAQESTISAAERSYQVARERLLKGVGTQLELTDAELALNQARTNRAQGVYDYLIARVDLDRTLGRPGH